MILVGDEWALSAVEALLLGFEWLVMSMIRIMVKMQNKLSKVSPIHYNF